LFVFGGIRQVDVLQNLATFAFWWLHFNSFWLIQQSFSKDLNAAAGKRGRRKNVLLTVTGTSGNFLDGLGKAHIQHPVCFIDDKPFNAFQFVLFRL